MIDYAPLPLSLSGADNEPVLWDEIGDHESFVYKVGDEEATEQAISRAPHVIKQTFVVNRITANSMEPRGAIGLYDPGNDHYTIHTGHQRPWAFRTSLTKNTFKIGEHQLSLITGDMGGSFGMKGSIYPEIPLVGWAAKRIGRPVKWVADRGEGISSDDHARDNVTEAELALDQNGNFLAMGSTRQPAMCRSGYGPLYWQCWRIMGAIRRQVCSWRSSAASAISIQSHHTEAPGDPKPLTSWNG